MKAGAEAMREALGAAIALHEQVRAADPGPLLTAVTAIVGSLRRGGKVMAFGNGGSAADAQHLAAELVGRFQMKRAALAAMALTTDTSVLTSVANDETFERVFARQIEALGRDGDVAVGISTSGRSANVTSALKAAELRGMRTIALTGGGGGDVAMAAEIRIAVPSDSTPRIQEVHRTLLHVICELVEKALL